VFGWFTRKAAQQPANPTRDAIWNEGLYLAMEWGTDWMKPIQPRLASRYPALTPAELDELDKLCRDAMKFGHTTVYDLAESAGKDTKYEDFARVMTRRYAWVDARNLSRLFSQGMYYAWKDMGF
jgi:hypothetical protein